MVDVGLFRLVCHKCKQPASYMATHLPTEVRDYLNKNSVCLCLSCGDLAKKAQTLESMGIK